MYSSNSQQFLIVVDTNNIESKNWIVNHRCVMNSIDILLICNLFFENRFTNDNLHLQ